jgi:signal transduction histidine kinase
VNFTDLHEHESSFVYGDGNRLSQLFYQLLKNAAIFSPHGGTIQVWSDIGTVEAKNGSVQAELTEYAIIQIQDQGIGIQEEYLSHIFEPYYRIESSERSTPYSGLGLGLTLC